MAGFQPPPINIQLGVKGLILKTCNNIGNAVVRHCQNLYTGLVESDESL